MLSCWRCISLLFLRYNAVGRCDLKIHFNILCTDICQHFTYTRCYYLPIVTIQTVCLIKTEVKSGMGKNRQNIRHTLHIIRTTLLCPTLSHYASLLHLNNLTACLKEVESSSTTLADTSFKSEVARYKNDRCPAAVRIAGGLKSRPWRVYCARTAGTSHET